MCNYEKEKAIKETYFKTEEVEEEVLQPLVHVRKKRSLHYVKHEIPVMVTKKQTHVYLHYYDYDVLEQITEQCQHVDMEKDNGWQ